MIIIRSTRVRTRSSTVRGWAHTMGGTRVENSFRKLGWKTPAKNSWRKLVHKTQVKKSFRKLVQKTQARFSGRTRARSFRQDLGKVIQEGLRRGNSSRTRVRSSGRKLGRGHSGEPSEVFQASWVRSLGNPGEVMWRPRWSCVASRVKLFRWTSLGDTLLEFRGIRFKLKFLNLKYIGSRAIPGIAQCKWEKLWFCYVAIIITVTTAKWCM